MCSCNYRGRDLAPAYLRWHRCPGPYAPTGPSLAGEACHCGGTCGPCAARLATKAAASVDAHDHGDEDCHCGGTCGPCAARERERAAGGVTPPGRPCAFGAARRADGRCPEDDVGGLGQAQTVPAGFDSWTDAQRREWAQSYARSQGMSDADARAFAERAAAADRALITGIINQGVSIIHDWITTRSAERVAEIEAESRIRVAEIQARSQSQGNLNPQPQPTPQPSSSSTVETIAPLALLFWALRGGL